MGSVFLVQHVHTDERLAMKLLHATVVNDAATLDRFRREARTPARIDSDHVVRVTDADVAPELDNVPFLVMEYLRGEDLQHLAERRGAIPPAEVVVLLSQAARALDKAHSLGIVHRDLKPENLFVTQRDDGSPCVKILDYGIAKMTGGSDLKEVGRLTATGQIFGTPLYMSPEQAMAESEKICPQSDVWALGLIAHRLLHGKEFWTATTLTHLVAQIAFEPIPAPSEVGSTLGSAYDDWFARCVCREITGRFKTCGEAISALAAALRVTDTPSQIARIPVSVRISTTNGLNDDRDVLGATSVSEAVTGPDNSQRSGSSLGRTQFDAETAKPARPRAIGFAIAGSLAVLGGGLLAWRITTPASGPEHPPAATTSPAVGASLSAGEPTRPTAPVVTPSPEVSGEVIVAPDPPSVVPQGPATSAPVKATSGSSGKPATSPSTQPTAASTGVATSTPAPPTTQTTTTPSDDPLRNRR